MQLDIIGSFLTQYEYHKRDTKKCSEELSALINKKEVLNSLVVVKKK